jgi:site-specific DNA recombinase
MTLRGGKSGRYRYYACSARARVGATACKGNVLPMAKLDELVMDALLERVLSPERMSTLIEEWRRTVTAADGGAKQILKSLLSREREAMARIGQLYDALEQRLIGDQDIFRARMAAAEGELRDIRGQIAACKNELHSLANAIQPKKLATVSAQLAELLQTGDLNLRKAYVRLFIQEVEVGGREINIVGSKDALAKAEAYIPKNPQYTVPFSMEAWRPRRDSNS